MHRCRAEPHAGLRRGPRKYQNEITANGSDLRSNQFPGAHAHCNHHDHSGNPYDYSKHRGERERITFTLRAPTAIFRPSKGLIIVWCQYKESPRSGALAGNKRLIYRANEWLRVRVSNPNIVSSMTLINQMIFRPISLDMLPFAPASGSLTNISKSMK